MNRIVQTLLAAALLFVAAPHPARAAATDPPLTATFESVEQVKMFTYRGDLLVRGVLSGEAAPVEYRYDFNDQAGASDCQKQALLAMDRPGRYFLTVSKANVGTYYDCALTRR